MSSSSFPLFVKMFSMSTMFNPKTQRLDMLDFSNLTKQMRHSVLASTSSYKLSDKISYFEFFEVLSSVFSSCTPLALGFVDLFMEYRKREGFVLFPDAEFSLSPLSVCGSYFYDMSFVAVSSLLFHAETDKVLQSDIKQLLALHSKGLSDAYAQGEFYLNGNVVSTYFAFGDGLALFEGDSYDGGRGMRFCLCYVLYLSYLDYGMDMLIDSCFASFLPSYLAWAFGLAVPNEDIPLPRSQDEVSSLMKRLTRAVDSALSDVFSNPSLAAALSTCLFTDNPCSQVINDVLRTFNLSPMCLSIDHSYDVTARELLTSFARTFFGVSAEKFVSREGREVAASYFVSVLPYLFTIYMLSLNLVNAKQHAIELSYGEVVSTNKVDELTVRCAELERRITELDASNKILRKNLEVSASAHNTYVKEHTKEITGYNLRLRDIERDKDAEILELKTLVSSLRSDIAKMLSDDADDSSDIAADSDSVVSSFSAVRLARLQTKKIVVVGGPVKWALNLRMLLPNLIIATADTDCFVGRNLQSVDLIVINTRMLGHSLFWGVRSYAVSAGVPYCFVTQQNTSAVLDLIDTNLEKSGAYK